jgi:Sec-independent protein translocase protein TatA
VLFVGLLVFVGFNFPFVDRSCGFFVGFVCEKSAVAREKSPQKKKNKQTNKQAKKKQNKTEQSLVEKTDRQTDRQTRRASDPQVSDGAFVFPVHFLSLQLLTVCLSVCVFCVYLSSVFLSFAVFVVIRCCCCCCCAAPPSIEICRERLRQAAAGGRRGWLLLAFCCSSIVTFQDATLQRTPQAWQ